ncbi:MAG: hypothetical protein ACREH6_12760, partial [Geminicoccaceae bacterium]
MAEDHRVEVTPSKATAFALASIDPRIISNESYEIYLLPQGSKFLGDVDLKPLAINQVEMTFTELHDLALFADRLDIDPSPPFEGRHTAFRKRHRLFVHYGNAGLGKLTT